VIHADDLEKVFAKNGAIEVVIVARDHGRVWFIGITGPNSPRIHNEMLDQADRHGFRYDTDQKPLNLLDSQFDSFERSALPRLEDDEIGVRVMKLLSSSKLLELGTDSAT
jgi:hypothetical protein